MIAPIIKESMGHTVALLTPCRVENVAPWSTFYSYTPLHYHNRETRINELQLPVPGHAVVSSALYVSEMT